MRKIALAAAALVIGTSGAWAQTTYIERERPVSKRVIIQERGPSERVVVRKRRVESTGSVGCRTVTVRRETDDGDIVTRKTRRCD